MSATTPTVKETKFEDWYYKCDYKGIRTLDELFPQIEIMKEFPAMAVDLETSGLDMWRDEIVGVNISWKEQQGVYIDIDSIGKSAFYHLKPILEKTKSIGYNIKFDMGFFKRVGIDITNYEDVQILVFLNNPNERMRGLKWAAEELLGLKTKELEDFFEKKKFIDFRALPWEYKVLYGCADTDLTLRLNSHLDFIRKKQSYIYQIETKLVRILYEMHERGIQINVDECRRQQEQVEKKLAEWKEEIIRITGCPNFNMESSKQMQDVLFNVLKITPNPKMKTEKGLSFRTDAEALKVYSSQNKTCEMIADWKSLNRDNINFLKKLPECINPLTQRIHSNLISCNVQSGRLCSRDPNLQNIPKVLNEKLREVYQVRNVFVAREGYTLVDCDYSQIELRVAAALSGEDLWVDAFNRGVDLHKEMAHRMYNVPKDQEVTSQQRQFAKNGNFGMLTGQSPMSFASMYNLPPEQAKEIYKLWWKVVPKVKLWRDENVFWAKRTNGLVMTFLGRKRLITDLFHHEDWKRRSGENQVVSHMVQGGAADIMKLALIILDKKIKESNLDIRMILSVHDQILFEVKDEILEEAIKMIKEGMEIDIFSDKLLKAGKIKAKVPIKIDMKTGKVWGKCQKLK